MRLQTATLTCMSPTWRPKRIKSSLPAPAPSLGTARAAPAASASAARPGPSRERSVAELDRASSLAALDARRSPAGWPRTRVRVVPQRARWPDGPRPTLPGRGFPLSYVCPWQVPPRDERGRRLRRLRPRPLRGRRRGGVRPVRDRARAELLGLRRGGAGQQLRVLRARQCSESRTDRVRGLRRHHVLGHGLQLRRVHSSGVD